MTIQIHEQQVINRFVPWFAKNKNDFKDKILAFTINRELDSYVITSFYSKVFLAYQEYLLDEHNYINIDFKNDFLYYDGEQYNLNNCDISKEILPIINLLVEECIALKIAPKILKDPSLTFDEDIKKVCPKLIQETKRRIRESNEILERKE